MNLVRADDPKRITREQRDERRAKLAERGLFCSCSMEEPTPGCVLCDTTQEELEEMIQHWEQWKKVECV